MGWRATETRQNLGERAKTKNEREQAGGPRELGARVRQEANRNFNAPRGGKL